MAYIEKRGTAKKPKYVARWKGPDGSGLSQTFATKGAAQAHLDKLAAGKAGGVNKTLGALCDEFMAHARALEAAGTRERSTVEQYRQHVAHMKRDEIAAEKLHKLGTPEVQRFLDRLIAGGMSVALAKKVRVTLGRIVGFGMRRGDILVNPVEATEIEEATRADLGEDGPVIIPPKEALAALLAAADARAPVDKGQAAAFVRVLLFCGLRMSELRGLGRKRVLAVGPRPHLKVVERADKWNKLGAPKSEGSRRDVPLGPETAQALRVWMLAAPKGEAGLVFPNGSGNIESHANFWNRLWAPLMAEAGLADKVTRKRKLNGKVREVEVWVPHYGFHAMRHAFASINIENGVTPKKLSSLMGHATIKLTMDTYGHLWPDHDGDAGIASAAEGLIAKAGPSRR